VGKPIKNDTQQEVRRPDLDIQKYGVSRTKSGPAFYVSVDNEILGGLVVPYWNNLTFPIITNATGGGGGKGPQPVPKTGEDFVYIFIDSISDYGYSGDMPISANYMIEVIGRHNEVISASYYNWTGTSGSDWNWKRLGPVDVGLDMVRMEVGINWDHLNLNSQNDTFEVYFYATDWEQHIKDYSDGEGVIRGTRATTLAELVTGSGAVDNDRFGWNISYAGDVNNDGYPDIIVGAPYNDTSDGTKADAGAAYIFFGYSGIDSSNINAASANVSIYGETAGDLLGWSVSDLGNVDSDTKDDIIIGAPGYDASSADIVWGPSDVKINQKSSAQDTWFPAVAADPNGNIIVVWEDYISSSDDDILAQKFDPGGNPLWGSRDLRVNQDSTAATRDYPKIAIDSDGNSIIVWDDERNGNVDIYAQKLAPNGTALWSSSDVKVNQNSDSADQWISDIALDLDGNAIVVWSDDRAGITDTDIYAQNLSSSTGSAQWGSTDKQVNQNSDTNSQTVPVVDTDSNGLAIVAWDDSRSGSAGIYAQKLNATGSALWGSSDKLVNQAGSSVDNPDLAVDDSDNTIVVWRDYRSSNWDVYAQKLNSAGTAQWGVSDKKVNQNSDSASQYEVAVDTDSSGNAIVVWEDLRVSGDSHIYAQKLDTSGSTQWGSSDKKINQNSDTEDQLTPDVVVDSNGNIYIVWQDERSDTLNPDTYAQKIHFEDAGRAYIFYGRASWSSSYSASSASVTIDANSNGDELGSSVSGAGDNDGSNYNDIIVGAPGYVMYQGRAYVFYGDGSIPTSAASADKTLTGEAAGDRFGFAVSNAGDVDNDGKDDVIIGAPYNDGNGKDSGRVYIYFGSDQYSYVGSNSTTYGFITDFNNAKSASDSGAYATLKEELIGWYGSGSSEITIDDAVDDATDEYNPSPGAVFINETDGYVFFIDDAAGSNNRQVSYRKTTDGGSTWGSEVSISSDLDYHNVAIWYDQWTPGLTGTKIHIVAIGDDNDNVEYRWLDTNDDSLRSSWVTVGDMGAFVPPDGGVSITNSTDGNLFALGFGTTPGVFKSTDNGSTWNDITPSYYFDAADDHAQLLPLSGGDIICIYHDSSTYWARYFVYDEGTDTWDGSATSIEIWYDNADANWGAIVDKSTGDIYLAANERPTYNNYDLKTYIFSDSSRTMSAKTDIITASGTACKDVKLIMNENNQDVFAVYIKGGTSSHVYYKKSTDGMTTWGSETQISTTLDDHIYLRSHAMSEYKIYAFWFNDDLNDLLGCTILNISEDYMVDIEFNAANVAVGDNYYLQLNYSVDGSETKFGIYAYNDTASDWDDLGSQGNLTSTSFTTVEFNLTSDHRLSTGNVRIRFVGRNETSDAVNSTLNIEYHRIRVTNAYTPLSGENSGNMFGWSVGNASDINADGSYDDVIIGAPNYRDEPYSYTWGSSDTKVEQVSNSVSNSYPAIAIDSNDNSIICWADGRDHVTYKSIYAQKLNSQGVAQWGSSDVKVNQSATNHLQPYPDIAVDSDGNSVIVWTDDRDGDYNIYAQKLDSSGNAQWGSSDVKVNQNSDSAKQDYPSVVIDSNDEAIVVWYDERNGVDDDDIYAQKLNSTGVAQWGSSDVKINQNSDSTIQRFSDVALYSDDSVIVTWSDYRSSSHYDIYVQKVSSSGSVLWGSTDIKVNQNSDSVDQTWPTVAVDPNGYAVVAWTDDRNGITDDDVYAQRLDARGSPLWGSSDVKVNQISNGDYHFYQDIAIDSEGNAFITWYNLRDMRYGVLQIFKSIRTKLTSDTSLPLELIRMTM
jgi:hypothetical protein